MAIPITIRAASQGCACVGGIDDVWRRWSAAPGGTDVEPVNTDYGSREGGHIDPDGNLLRYGSRV